MINQLDEFYLEKEEPLKSCLMALRDIILHYREGIYDKWYYRLPCFFYKDKIFCYVWVDRKTQHPYIALYPGKRLHHPALVLGNRKESKIFSINPNEDIPIETIHEIFEEALSYY